MPGQQPPAPEDVSLTEPHSARPGRATASNLKTDAETVTEGAGGFIGAVSGMALGALAGPVGLVIGGLAGALGGWWTGHKVADVMQESDDHAFRAHYESSSERMADRSYEDTRPAYVAGHLAARNPDYANKPFEDVETDLRRGWNSDVAAQLGEWSTAQPYARAAYERARESGRTR